jgi:glycosyltransferase involved in cell wall biosynthesis
VASWQWLNDNVENSISIPHLERRYWHQRSRDLSFVYVTAYALSSSNAREVQGERWQPGFARRPNSGGRYVLLARNGLLMRISVFLNLRFYEHHGRFRADEHYFRFWAKLAEHYEHVTLCVPTAVDVEGGTHPVELDTTRVSICPLPMYRSSLELYTKFPVYAWKASKCCGRPLQNCDVFVAVIPNLLGMWLGAVASRMGVECVYYLRGNLAKTVENEYRSQALRSIPLALSHVLEIGARHQMRKHLSFVVGGELHRFYSALGIDTIPIITSLISQKEIKQYVPRSSLSPVVRLLAVGRLSEERGVATLLEALAILNGESRFNLLCRIVGEGPQRSHLQAKARDLGLDNVTFTGAVLYGNELMSHYRWADIFVLPSYTEGFPKVVLEAMANAVPVIATAVGGIPDILRSGHDCILIQPRSARALADGISELVNNVGLLNCVGLNAYNTVQSLTYEKQSAIFIDALQERLDSRATRKSRRLR